MPRFLNGLRIVLDVIGVGAIMYLLFIWCVGAMFKGFAGVSCTDTDQKIITSPDGKHTIKSFHRSCGSPPSGYGGYFVYLSTGNPNKGYEYAPIADFDQASEGQVSVVWEDADQVSITYPPSAKIGDVYAKVLGVRVILHPEIPKTPR